MADHHSHFHLAGHIQAKLVTHHQRLQAKEIQADRELTHRLTLQLEAVVEHLHQALMVLAQHQAPVAQALHPQLADHQ